MNDKRIETTAQAIFFLCASSAVVSFLLITIFILMKGLPAILQIGPIQFLFGATWDPGRQIYGILPMTLASIATTGAAFLFGSFIGKWAAIFLTFFCPKKVYPLLKSMVELMAGVPSIIYGFFGVTTIVPLIRNQFGGPGKSMLAVIIILTLMILPTIINLSENALQSVPKTYYEGALSLGNSHNEAVFQVMVPAARSGIYSSYILGLGRALGETMAIQLVAGNNPLMPTNLLKPIRTLTTGIAMEMNYASGLHQQALFGIGVILFLFILLLNILLSKITKKGDPT